MYWPITIVLDMYRHNVFPNSLIYLLDDVISYLKTKPYSEEFQNSLLRSLEKAIELLSKNPKLEETLRLIPLLPSWFVMWASRKKICLDLSTCDLRTQRILTSVIFQTIKNLVPHTNSDVIQGMVMIDDANQLFKRIPSEKYDYRYLLMKEQIKKEKAESYLLTKERWEEIYGDKEYFTRVKLARFFEDMIYNEFRIKHVSLVTATNSPLQLLDAIPFMSQLKILFRLGIIAVKD